MSEKLDVIKSEYISKLRKLSLLDAGMNYNDIETYEHYLKSDEPEELEQEAQAIVSDVNQEDNFGDPSENRTTWKIF